jgi:hypothetical protein
MANNDNNPWHYRDANNEPLKEGFYTHKKHPGTIFYVLPEGARTDEPLGRRPCVEYSDGDDWDFQTLKHRMYFLFQDGREFGLNSRYLKPVDPKEFLQERIREFNKTIKNQKKFIKSKLEEKVKTPA